MEVYLDNSATTRVYPETAELMMKILTEDFGNPSSMHKCGVTAEHYVKQAQEQAAKSIHVLPEEILFTSGGTESNNQALIGSALAKRRIGKHIISTNIEHPSVGAALDFLEKEGYQITRLPVNEMGIVTPEQVVEAMQEDTILVSVMMVNNEIGSILPIAEIAALCRDAGVPLKRTVAGISIGLFTNDDQSQKVLVTDILGAEDHCGDMDFKIGGTRDGITGFQVDLKIRGLTWALVEKAIERDRVARMKILDFIESVLPAPRAELSPHAPRIKVIQINPEKIGALIGPGGKNIRGICALTGAQIDIAEDDSGKVSIYATSKESMDAAEKEINKSCAEPEEGMLYEGTVTGVKAFGAFVEILPGIDGLCHISEFSDKFLKSMDGVCKEGDKLWVKCIGVDDRGRIKLSRKAALAEMAEKPQA